MQMKKNTSTAIILAIFSAIPRTVRRKTFVALFLLFYHVSPRRRLIAIHNLKRAFPEKNMDEIVAIAKGVYRNMAIVAADFFEIPKLTPDNLSDLIEVEGLEHCRKALEKNKGVLMFGSHFGNWELGAIALSLRVKPSVVIYRILDNPVLENVVTWVRSCTGNIPLAKEFAMRSMLRHLKKNDILGILIDQNVSVAEGVFVDFFGRPACTTNGLALLALHTGAPVLPGYALRLDDGRYRFAFGEEVELVRTGDREQDILVNTQNFTRIIEATVRKYPDQWLWVHQRWKTTLSK
ncbi:MAG: lipid A biosynthesis acyltransferase [Syntrophus sp. (in: bacteria)]|nr:lipid A biosynthesis acyltransferase [Syntrophus sp. (in: bacteria)]